MSLLTRDDLLAAAKEQAGLEDFGDESFLEALDMLVTCLNTEADLSEAGEMMLFQQYLQLLINRLRFQEDLKKHPEILSEELAPPIVVLGLPRSGTTKFHRVLAAHPDTQSLPLWKLMNPAPYPDAGDTGQDPRIEFAKASINLMAELYPDTLAGHPMDAEEAEEESQYLMEMTFDGPLVPVRAHLPSFTEWRWQRSMTPCYEYLRTLLQYLQWQSKRSGNPKPPFVLKNPLHLGHIDTLLEVFPGATVVHCHRDPIDSVPSFARLVEVGWNMVCDRKDLVEFGEVATQLLHTHMTRYLSMRPRLEANNRFIDVSFKDIVMDSHAQAADCFKAHGLPYNEDVQSRIEQWEADNPTPEHGQHEYSIERYSLNEDSIKNAFASYYSRYLNH